MHFFGVFRLSTRVPKARQRAGSQIASRCPALSEQLEDGREVFVKLGHALRGGIGLENGRVVCHGGPFVDTYG